MKIVSGKGADWSYEFTCRSCRRRMKAEYSDLYNGWVEVMYGWQDDGYVSAMVKCICGTEKEVKSPPKGWKKRHGITS